MISWFMSSSPRVNPVSGSVLTAWSLLRTLCSSPAWAHSLSLSKWIHLIFFFKCTLALILLGARAGKHRTGGFGWDNSTSPYGWNSQSTHMPQACLCPQTTSLQKWAAGWPVGQSFPIPVPDSSSFNHVSAFNLETHLARGVCQLQPVGTTTFIPTGTRYVGLCVVYGQMCGHISK